MNYLAASLQGVQRSQIRLCRECKDYVIGREITTKLKITVDNAKKITVDNAICLSDMVSTEINDSSGTALECALRS